MPKIRIKDLTDNKYLSFDLQDILKILGTRVTISHWECKVGECIFIDGFDNLYLEYDKEGKISGDKLIELSKNTRQIIDGIFKGYFSNNSTPWIIIEAIDSSFWEVETQDESILALLKSKFINIQSL